MLGTRPICMADAACECYREALSSLLCREDVLAPKRPVHPAQAAQKKGLRSSLRAQESLQNALCHEMLEFYLAPSLPIYLNRCVEGPEDIHLCHDLLEWWRSHPLKLPPPLRLCIPRPLL